VVFGRESSKADLRARFDSMPVHGCVPVFELDPSLAQIVAIERAAKYLVAEKMCHNGMAGFVICGDARLVRLYHGSPSVSN